MCALRLLICLLLFGSPRNCACCWWERPISRCHNNHPHLFLLAQLQSLCTSDRLSRHTFLHQTHCTMSRFRLLQFHLPSRTQCKNNKLFHSFVVCSCCFPFQLFNSCLKIRDFIFQVAYLTVCLITHLFV